MLVSVYFQVEFVRPDLSSHAMFQPTHDGLQEHITISTVSVNLKYKSLKGTASIPYEIERPPHNHRQQ